MNPRLGSGRVRRLTECSWYVLFVRVLDQAIDTSTPTGRLMFNMLGSIAQVERELMLERQREGIAKAEGKYKGRKPTAMAKTPEIKRMMADGIAPRP
jgi:DNA invertase Pin-like site-specific DNA recombinase